MKVIEVLIERQDLSEEQAQQALTTLVEGGEPAQMAAFLVLLRAKGETAAEVAGLAKAMRSFSLRVHTSTPGALLRQGGVGPLDGCCACSAQRWLHWRAAPPCLRWIAWRRQHVH